MGVVTQPVVSPGPAPTGRGSTYPQFLQAAETAVEAAIGETEAPGQGEAAPHFLWALLVGEFQIHVQLLPETALSSKAAKAQESIRLWNRPCGLKS